MADLSPLTASIHNPPFLLPTWSPMLLRHVQFNCSALLFDMDGTLLNSEASTARAYAGWAAKYGLDLDHVLRSGQGRRTQDTLRQLAPPGANLEADIHEIMRAEREDTEGVVEIAGARAFLRALPPERWAIVTSADRRLAQARLSAAGIPLPAVLVTAEDVQRGKPAPDGYLLAAQRLGVAADRCVVFEDAPAGLAAGAAACARVIAVSSTLMAGRLDPFDSIDDYQGLSVAAQGTDLILSIA